VKALRSGSLVVLVFALLAALPAARAADAVALVAGHPIERSALAGPAGEAGEDGEAGRLLVLLWQLAAAHYVETHGLGATDAERAEFIAYHQAFDRHDRAQRTRKLAELDARLAAADLAASERTWLEEFRAVLQRLARYDAEADLAPAQEAERIAALAAPWIEAWKLNRAIQERYGGVVALTLAGPVPYGARAALVRDYEQRGIVRFEDAGLRERLYRLLDTPPSTVVPADAVDFTPYWQRPIVPSYFPG